MVLCHHKGNLRFILDMLFVHNTMSCFPLSSVKNCCLVIIEESVLMCFIWNSVQQQINFHALVDMLSIRISASMVQDCLYFISKEFTAWLDFFLEIYSIMPSYTFLKLNLKNWSDNFNGKCFLMIMKTQVYYVLNYFNF